MRNTRLYALILAILMLVAIIAGCNGSKPAETTPAPAAGTTTPTPATDPATTEPENTIPSGYVFHLITQNLNPANQAEAKGEALLAIMQSIEDEFDIVMEYSPQSGKTIDDMVNSIISGVKIADFASLNQRIWIPLASMGGLRALDSEEMLEAGLDLFNNDVFYQHYTQMGKIKNHIWGLNFMGVYEWIGLGHTYAFNKRLVADAGYPAETLYQAVRDGTWDYDLFLTIAREVAEDTDGDQKNDIWGVALDCDGNEVWTNGTGPILLGDDGKWQANLFDPNLLAALAFMTNVSGDPHVQASLEGEAVPSRGARRTTFYEGNAAFAGLTGNQYGQGGTFQMADEYGLLPMPKGPNAENYTLNMVDVNMYVCPTSNQGWEHSAKIMTAIGRAVNDEEAHKEYYFEQLASDEDALEMVFEYLLPNAMLNVAKCSDEMYQLTRFDFYDRIYKGNITPAAAAEAYNHMVQNELDRVFRQLD